MFDDGVVCHIYRSNVLSRLSAFSFQINHEFPGKSTDSVFDISVVRSCVIVDWVRFS